MKKSIPPYSKIRIDRSQAKSILDKYYKMQGKITELPGELDFNFRVNNESGTYILKVSRPDIKKDFIDYQYKILKHINKSSTGLLAPQIIKNSDGSCISRWMDNSGQTRWVRLYTWIDGKMWSSIKPHNDSLLFSLGIESAQVTKVLQDFDHPLAHREFEWDINQASWTHEFIDLFTGELKSTVTYFQNRFLEILQ